MKGIQSIIRKSRNPVILLEGTRQLPASEVQNLIHLGESLATEFPQARFRTGNAGGTDENFARGVANINPQQLEYVLPYRTMRKYNMQAGARVISLDELPAGERENIKSKTVSSYPSIAKLIDHYFKTGIKNRVTARALYLLRDTLKVIGSPGLKLQPAVLGIFYVNPEKPDSGGTGHTIRVCKQNGVKVTNQFECTY